MLDDSRADAGLLRTPADRRNAGLRDWPGRTVTIVSVGNRGRLANALDQLARSGDAQGYAGQIRRAFEEAVRDQGDDRSLHLRLRLDVGMLDWVAATSMSRPDVPELGELEVALWDAWYDYVAFFGQSQGRPKHPTS